MRMSIYCPFAIFHLPTLIIFSTHTKTLFFDELLHNNPLLCPEKESLIFLQPGRLLLVFSLSIHWWLCFLSDFIWKTFINSEANKENLKNTGTLDLELSIYIYIHTQIYIYIYM